MRFMSGPLDPTSHLEEGVKSTYTPPLSSRSPCLAVKVIIRGERNTGKTSLFHRLQGGRFTDAYQPTDQIQASAHMGGVVHAGGSGPCVGEWSSRGGVVLMCMAVVLMCMAVVHV